MVLTYLPLIISKLCFLIIPIANIGLILPRKCAIPFPTKLDLGNFEILRNLWCLKLNIIKPIRVTFMLKKKKKHDSLPEKNIEVDYLRLRLNKRLICHIQISRKRKRLDHIFLNINRNFENPAFLLQNSFFSSKLYHSLWL